MRRATLSLVAWLVASPGVGAEGRLPKELDGYAKWQPILKEPHEVPRSLALLCAPPSPAFLEKAEKENGPHTRRFIRVTANPAAVSALPNPAQKRRYPAGAAIAKAKFLKSPDGSPDGVGFMIKREGPEFRKTGGWEFVYFPRSGDPRKTHEACASCHQGAASTDYVFGKYEPSAVR
jgi:hypothetical protein